MFAFVCDGSSLKQTLQITLTSDDQQKLARISAEMGMIPGEYLPWLIRDAYEPLIAISN